jgi:predicted DsbA family dithiol-disulfide isomerase
MGQAKRRIQSMSEASSTHIKLTVVSDYVCPWCFIGLTRVDQLQRDYESLEVEWMPYELRPNTPAEGVPFDRLRGRPPYTDEYLGTIRDLAGEAGIDMAEREFVPNSLPSLKAAEWARDHNCFPELHRAMFSAYFEDKRNIGELAVLRAIADGLGLDGASMVAAIESGAYDDRLEEKLQWSRVAGQGGVPRFIFLATFPNGETRRAGFAGAQEYVLFQQFMRRLGARQRRT